MLTEKYTVGYWENAMTNSLVQSCTVCGAVADSKYLFNKTNEGLDPDQIEVYRCGRCKTVFLGKYSELYDDGLYAYYSKYFGKEEEDIYDPLTRISYEQVLRLFESFGGRNNILDVGCGNGGFVKAALQQGYIAEGIELSQPAVDVAQRFGLPVTKVDFFSKSILDSSRDIVTMFEVIEHLPEPVEFLRRAEIVVKPGGLVYLTTPNFDSLDRRVLGAGWNVFHREHLTYFTIKTLLALIRKNTALDVLHIETRNISNELITYFRNLGSTNLTLRESPILVDEIEVSRVPDARTRIARSQWLSLLKRGANVLLNAASLGSTIVMVLKRPGEVDE